MPPTLAPVLGATPSSATSALMITGTLPPGVAAPSRDMQITEEDALCVICFDEYEDGDPLHVYKCGHHFHCSCSAEWLGLSKLCPLCKRNVQVMLHPELASIESGSDAEEDEEGGAGREEVVEMRPVAAATAAAPAAPARE
ncbi:hypothetical protein BC828DRAFT_394544 [Blastocladiella britannica]|nr:hypothetical protein BC828DRAFT_394544 [Blastocladiella britannica]